MQNSQNETANIVIFVTAFISTIATCSVFVKFASNRLLWNFEYVMIVTLCACDLIQSISIEIPVIVYWINESYPNNTACTLQGFFQQFACIGQFIWTFNIAYTIWRQMKPESQKQRSVRKILLLIAGVLIPLTMALIPIFEGTYGNLSLSKQSVGYTVCFIIQPLGSIIFFVVPMVLTFLLNLVFFSLTCRRLNKTSELVFENHNSLMAYPFILLFCQGWFALYFIISTFDSQNLYGYLIWCYGSSNLMGLFDSLAYGLNSYKDLKIKKIQSAKHQVMPILYYHNFHQDYMRVIQLYYKKKVWELKCNKNRQFDEILFNVYNDKK